MSISAVDDALLAAAPLLLGVNPSPSPGPVASWAYPAQYGDISFDVLPVIVVSEVVNKPMRWAVKSAGKGIHRWEMEILVFLAEAQLTNHEAAAPIERLQTPWYKALADKLFANMSLGLSVPETWIGRGTGEASFGILDPYHVGHIHFDTRTFWGIRAIVPVYQLHNQPMTASEG